jgi:hypothetical protein
MHHDGKTSGDARATFTVTNVTGRPDSDDASLRNRVDGSIGDFATTKFACGWKCMQGTSTPQVDGWSLMPQTRHRSRCLLHAARRLRAPMLIL